MGFVTMGIFSFTVQGVDGAIFQMLSHGLVSAALFLCVGVVYDRMHTREIAAYGGLVNRMPIFAFVFMVFTLANVGLPGTSGFIGEFLTLVGAFKANTWVAFLATIGVILSAAYALYLYRRMMFGPLEKRSLKAIADMGYREIAVFAPLVALVILFGFYPAPLLDVTAVSVKKLVSGYETAIKSASNSAPASPPPSWGRDRVGGIAEHLPSGLPPPLTPPHVVSKTRLRHEGEGDSRAAAAVAPMHSKVSRP